MGEILNIMEGYDPLPAFGSPALLHREAEAMRRAFTDRNTYLGDPAFVQNPLDRLLSKELRGRAAGADRRPRIAHTGVRSRAPRAARRRPTTRWWTPTGTR